jgi:hypothetical protein
MLLYMAHTLFAKDDEWRSILISASESKSGKECVSRRNWSHCIMASDDQPLVKPVVEKSRQFWSSDEAYGQGVDHMAVAKRRFDLAKSNADFATTAGSVGHTGQRPAEGTVAEESLSGRYVGGDIFRAETEDRIK